MDVMIGLGAACLLIRLGLVLYCTGLPRAKTAAGAVLRVLTDLCVSTLAMWAVGAAILLQTNNSFLGINPKLIILAGGGTGSLFFLITVVLVGTGVVGGAMAERARFFPVCAASVLMAALVIPIGAHW